MNRGLKVAALIMAFIVVILGTVLITMRMVTGRYERLLRAGDGVAGKTAEIAAYIDAYYVDEYDEEALADAAAEAMVEATGDRWSFYLNPEEYEEYLTQYNNAYVGIGVMITERTELGGMYVESVTEGGPAFEAGIEVGDVILSVDGQATLDLGMEGTQKYVRGAEGTSLIMVFSRNGSEFTKELVRRSIETVVASYRMLNDRIAYIRIVNFDARCFDETSNCISQAMNDGAEGIVFDVRFNPGGLKDELVKLLDYLLPEGPLFRSKDYKGREEVDDSDDSCLEIPMAVLVNGDSYSAAEFFAAALQEYGWATVVGSQTCGKGNFQTRFMLSDGSMLNLSIGKYYTPNGLSLTETGVTPDITVDMNEEEYASLYYGVLEDSDDGQLSAAVAEIQKKIS